MSGSDTVTPVVLYNFRKPQIQMIHNHLWRAFLADLPMFTGLTPKKRLNWLISDICTKSSCLPGTEHFSLVKHRIQHPYESNNLLYTLGSRFSVVSMEITPLPLPSNSAGSIGQISHHWTEFCLGEFPKESRRPSSLPCLSCLPSFKLTPENICELSERNEVAARLHLPQPAARTPCIQLHPSHPGRWWSADSSTENQRLSSQFRCSRWAFLVWKVFKHVNNV